MKQLPDIARPFTFGRTFYYIGFRELSYKIHDRNHSAWKKILNFILAFRARSENHLQQIYSGFLHDSCMLHCLLWEDNYAFHPASSVSVGDLALEIWVRVLWSNPGRELDLWSHVIQGGVGNFCMYSQGC